MSARRLLPAVVALALVAAACTDDADDAGDTAAVVAAPGLAGLTHLNLQRNAIGVAGVTALARSPTLTALSWLDLACNFGVQNRGIALLARSPVIAGLTLWFVAWLLTGASFITVGIFPMGQMVISIIWGLFEVPIAALAGAWLYREGA